MIPASHFLALSAVLFCIGTIGFVVRRNAIVAFMCVELMINAANIAFLAFTEAAVHAQISVFFVMAVAAAEAGVGLAIIIAVFRLTVSVDTENMSELKG